MDVLRSLRQATRALFRSPMFTIVAVLAIALGVGASTAVFTVVDGALLRPLGYPAADRLYSLYSAPASSPEVRGPPSFPYFEDWRAQSRSFSQMAFVRGQEMLMRGADGAVRLGAARVSEGFFALMGEPALVGRTFTPEEERVGGPNVVVLGHALWQSTFGGDRSIVGRTISTLGGEYVVVGVMPASFDFPAWADLYTPLAPFISSDLSLAKRDFRVDNRAIGRLAPGVSPGAAAADLDAIARRLAEAWPQSNEGWKVNPVLLRDEIVGDSRRALLVASGAVALVLLIACANVANLMLVRASARTREIAVRLALGAGRGRIAWDLLLESSVIAASGGVLGLAFAWAGLGLLRAAAPANVPRLDELALDGRVLAFTILSCALATLLFGLAPALHTARTDLAAAMKEGSGGGGRGARGTRLRSLFVAAELSLAVVLLVGAGLLMRSFARLRSVDPGFEVEKLVTVRVVPSGPRYDTPDKLLAFFRRVDEELSSIAGVRGVALINHLPMSGAGVTTPIVIEGRPPDPGNERPSAVYRLADDQFFATIGQRIVAGRAFSRSDMTPSSSALIISEGMARRYWPNESPVGKRVTVFKQAVGRPDYNAPVAGEVVGVVADVKYFDLTEDPGETVYVPFPVNPWRSAYFAVRAAGDPVALVSSVRRAVAAVDPDIPLRGTQAGFSQVVPVSDMLARSLAPRRFDTALLGAFAAAALVLATIGVYGTVAYAVTQRTREIGLRSALGATRRTLVRLFVGEGLRLAVAAGAVGLALAAAVTRLLASLLYGVGVLDVPTFAGVLAVIVGVAALASWIPARRAARVDPVIALRSE